MTIELIVSTSQREELIDITSQLRKKVKESGVLHGLCTVFVPHTTAGLTLNQNADAKEKKALLNYFRKKDEGGEGTTLSSIGNTEAHIKASLMGFSETLIIENHALVLGNWQAVYLCEFDGPRQRRILLQFLRG